MIRISNLLQQVFVTHTNITAVYQVKVISFFEGLAS